MKIIILLLLSLNLFAQLDTLQVNKLSKFPSLHGYKPKWDTLEVNKLTKIPKLLHDIEPSCLISPEFEFNYEDGSQLEVLSVTDHCIPIYVETDYFTYQSFGSNYTAVENWIKALMNEVAVLYRNEEINIMLSDYYIPTEPSWADALTSAETILRQFGGVRGDTIRGRLKHFITRRNMGGGIAWVNTLCMNSTQFSGGWFGPYAVSTGLSATIVPFPAYSWNVMVFAHEMGHNLGSRHTQACVWGPTANMAIDNCWTQEQGPCSVIMPIEYSTIMSYCHLTSNGINFNVGFGELPGNFIRNKINGASCIHRLETLILSGNQSGMYIGDTIFLNNVNSQNLFLLANEVTIENTELLPIFTVTNLTCN